MATKQFKGGDVSWVAKRNDASDTSRAFGYPGEPVALNSPELKKVRDYGPIDVRVIYSFFRSNPDIMGEENWRRYDHGGDVPFIQQQFARAQKTNAARYYYELTNPRVTNRFNRSDDTLDKVVTHTPSSDWFRDMHVSMNKASSTPGQGTLMVNNVRYADNYRT